MAAIQSTTTATSTAFGILLTLALEVAAAVVHGCAGLAVR